MEQEITERIQNYWTRRAHDFGLVRWNELGNALSSRWLEEFESQLPPGGNLRILDIGTGTGYFAILLAMQGHEVTGIDLTEAMLAEARLQADEKNVRADFRRMDAQELDFPDNTFDAVISRNLTWTLPEPKTAYAEWLRVLKPGGVLLNFDANYGNHEKSCGRKSQKAAWDAPYGHLGLTEEMEQENREITLSMEISRADRPAWDIKVLEDLGCRECSYDQNAGKRILIERDLDSAPLFLIRAKKILSVRAGRGLTARHKKKI